MNLALFDDKPHSISPLPEGVLRGRYMEYADECTYSLWGGGKVETRYMHTDQLPEWLARIVTAARLGGHEMRVFSPPPTKRLWFDLNMQRELINFIDGSKHDVS